MASASDALRQSNASMAKRSGAWPNTPPAMPSIMARPLNRAKRVGGNHCPATAMAPTRLKAAEAPIRKRPAQTAQKAELSAKTTQPSAQQKPAAAISRRGPKRSIIMPTGICMPA
jgi:hypothetical protein